MPLGPNDPNNPNQTNTASTQNTLNNQKQRSASGFTNLQRVLGASSQNKLGQAVGGGISDVAGQAKSGIQQAQNQFQQQAQQSRLGTDQNQQLRDSVIGKATQGNLSDEDVQKFQPLFQGRYGGPTEISQPQATQIQQKATEAQQLGQATQNPGGRYGLLQRFAASGPQYTAGQSRLDNLLLGQSGNQQLQQARRATTGLEQQAQGAITSAQQQGQTLKSEAQQFGQDTAAQLKGQVGNLQQQTQQQAQTQQDQQAQDVQSSQALQAKLAQIQNNPLTANAALTPDEYAKLGLTGDEYVNDVNWQGLSQNLSNNVPGANATVNPLQTMTDQQKAQALALNRLSGGAEGYNPLGITDQTKVGGYKPTDLYQNSGKVATDTMGDTTKKAYEGATAYQNQTRNEFGNAISSLLGQQQGPMRDPQREAQQAADSSKISQQLSSVANPQQREKLLKSAILSSQSGQPIFDKSGSIRLLPDEQLGQVQNYGNMMNSGLATQFATGQLGQNLYNSGQVLNDKKFTKLKDMLNSGSSK